MYSSPQETENAYELFARGRALLLDGHPHAAVVVLDRAKRLEPEKASIREALGRALFMSGLVHRARREFTKVVQWYPADDYAHFALALACERTGQRSRARGHAKLATVLHPGVDAYERVLQRLVDQIVLVEVYDAVLFDLDGVVYRGHEPMPGAAATIAELRALGKAVSFVTNNSSRTPSQVVAHLRSVGVDADIAEVVTSSLVTADLLASRGIRRAFVIGEDGLRHALTEAGISIADGGGDDAEVVVVGLDRTVDYDRLRIASILVQGGAALLGSNADASFPAPDGRNWPGAGALLAAIETTTGVAAEVVGKPAAPLLLAALARAGGGRPLMVGDRIDTDVAGATALGWDSALVLTGVTGRAEATSSSTPPTFVLASLRELTT